MVSMCKNSSCTLSTEPCMRTEVEKPRRRAWNSGIAQGKKRPFTEPQLRAIETALGKGQLYGKRDAHKHYRDLALLTLETDTYLRTSDTVRKRVSDLCYFNSTIKERISTVQEKKNKQGKRVVESILTEPVRIALSLWIAKAGLEYGDYLFPGKYPGTHLTSGQHRRIIKSWARLIGLPDEEYSTHSMRRTKAIILYEESGHDITVPKEALGHDSIKSTQEYVGVAIARVLEMSGRIVLFGDFLNSHEVVPLKFSNRSKL